MATNFSPITKKIEEVNESTKKLREKQKLIPIEIKNLQTNITSLPNRSKLSNKVMETLGALMNSCKYLNLIQHDWGRASNLGISIFTLGGDRLKMDDNSYDLTLEVYKTLCSTSYTGKNMKDENDTLTTDTIENELNLTGIADKSSKRKLFLIQKFPKIDENLQNKIFDEIISDSDNLEGEGVEKLIIPSSIIDIYTRVEVLLAIKISGHINTLTEASNLLEQF